MRKNPSQQMSESELAAQHPELPNLLREVQAGKVDRREFIRTVTLLGVSAATAYSMAGLIEGDHLMKPAEGGQERRRAENGHGRTGDDGPGEIQLDGNGPMSAGKWPEYLTITGPDNVTRPMLAESWKTVRRFEDLDLQPAQGCEVR